MSDKPIKNVVSFSGGKDSTALLLWAREHLASFETVWMDTGWEHPLTYRYVDYIDEEVLGGTLLRLSSDEYDGLEDLSKQKGTVPSTKARFCTQELKLKPLIAYFDSLRDKFEIHNYVGIRGDESKQRFQMPKRNFDSDYYGAWIHRPLLEWTAHDVFDTLERHGVRPNPLYKMGMKRVGCMPCVMSNHTDMRQIIDQFPEVVDEVRALEEELGRSFFPPGYIPDRFCSRSKTYEIEVSETVEDMFGERQVTVTKEKTSHYPMIDDVVAYLREDDSQLDGFNEPQSCMSHYGICE
jgi:3'-phosphoadenosine 5'-phosphosulfate sulfotransferase (PAPS reductase)/FAD synthetase